MGLHSMKCLIQSWNIDFVASPLLPILTGNGFPTLIFSSPMQNEREWIWEWLHAKYIPTELSSLPLQLSRVLGSSLSPLSQEMSSTEHEIFRTEKNNSTTARHGQTRRNAAEMASEQQVPAPVWYNLMSICVRSKHNPSFLEMPMGERK